MRDPFSFSSAQPFVPTTMLGNGEGGTSALLNLVEIDRLRGPQPLASAAPEKAPAV